MFVFILSFSLFMQCHNFQMVVNTCRELWQQLEEERLTRERLTQQLQQQGNVITTLTTVRINLIIYSSLSEFVCLSLSHCLSVSLFRCLSFSLSVCQSFYLPAFPCVYHFQFYVSSFISLPWFVLMHCL